MFNEAMSDMVPLSPRNVWIFLSSRFSISVRKDCWKQGKRHRLERKRWKVRLSDWQHYSFSLLNLTTTSILGDTDLLFAGPPQNRFL